MSDSQREELKDSDELLHRQVHPKLMNEGRPQRIAFEPNTSDAGELSVDRGSITNAESSHQRYVAGGLLSVGTWSVTVSEVAVSSLQAFEDPLSDNQAHAVIRFGEYSKSRWRRASKALADFAVTRGPSYLP